MTENKKSFMALDKLEKYGLTSKVISDYGYLLSGQFGRLIFSAVYFVTLARALSLSDFGLFATASAIGVVLSRISGFGFISPLYRVATTKPRLLGCYTAGYIVAVLASLPLVLLLTLGIYATLYADSLSLSTFLWVIAAEVLFWRALEVVIIVLNGQQKFGTGSGLTILGIANKTVAALGFAIWGMNDLATWAVVYGISNFCLAVTAIGLFYPGQRLRWRPKAWWAKRKDAFSVSAAEVLFYLQAELDKILVLAFGGEAVAGLYSIIMRLVDLTAMPLRAFNTMLVQWIMRLRQSGKNTYFGIALDGGVFLVSALGLLGIWFLLQLAAPWVGDNVILGTSFLLPVLLVPGFRNCIEYHSELLYAHEKTTARAWLLALLALLKAALLAVLLLQFHEFKALALWLNAVFAILYAISALATYRFILKSDE